MKIGLIGLGMVGGTLKNYLKETTKHHLALRDPAKGMDDDLSNSDAIFISVPVPSTEHGQDTKILTQVVQEAQKYSKNVFIRSTVLPGTNDSYGTISCPEFLTARRADHDMNKLPILVGHCDVNLISTIFPFKEFIMVKNTEAEMAKFAHNCFGAFKVTYFNVIKQLCDFHKIDYEAVKSAANITGYLGKEHLQVPGHDGKLGYGGTCFPVNMQALSGHLKNISKIKALKKDFNLEAELIETVRHLNLYYRGNEI